MITTCPVPDDVNPLLLTGFQFSVAKLPELTFWVQNTEIPNVSLGASTTGTPLSDIRHPGEKLEFGDLSVRFLVDSQMKKIIVTGQSTRNREIARDLINQQHLSPVIS